ncbi:MAG: zf-HC2 domain-containing protein [Anaerolineales bacterium]|nr:zf-HC2 domain-containing protein [Anaerolineales bacterium]
MSDHILELLDAFIDGELHGGQLHKVEAHLDECQSCLEEYYALQALSATLRDAPVPDFPSPERFAAEVALRLPRTPIKPVSKQALEFGWWLAPVGLIVAWIFASTTILVSNVVTAAGDFGLLDSASAWLVTGPSGANYSAFLGQFGLLAGTNLEWAEVIEAFTRTNVSQIFWQVSIALLYLSWLAIWWARHTRQGLRGAFDNGNVPEGGSRPTVK